MAGNAGSDRYGLNPAQTTTCLYDAIKYHDEKRLTTPGCYRLLLLTTSAHAYDVTGRLTNWYDMKKSGWTSADGYDDVKMLNALGLKADIIGYYPGRIHFCCARPITPLCI
jgi:hypothetical protein